MNGKRAMFAAPNRRSGVIYTDSDEEPCECDCCDKKKPCVHIDIGLVDFVWIICKDCLNEFIYHFYNETEIRKEKLKKIDGKER